MNKLLAKLLGILNGLIALIFIVAGAAAGYAVSEGTGLILGLLGGMIFAIFFCGYARLCFYARELVAIRDFSKTI
ncbi:MAG: hypothetical protein CM1200mP40_27970 [Gammaproteobacteria bacterium]|nr:MAG: hypothetical protein CM1200mP40_27970 [Gammaproteobacteria bacterium]